MSGHTPSTSISGIILTGFMGAGKTAAGALLAQRLGWRFVDSDHLVETRAAMTVAEIFERQGEAAFRELEAEAIRETILGEHVVLALGGGALERPATREFLASLATWRLVFLEAPLETLIDRCSGQSNAPVRPVLRDREALAERWTARLPWYRQAHWTVATGGRTLEEVVACILDSLNGEIANGPAHEPLCTAGSGEKRA